MFTSRTAKHFRAVAAAMAITFLANYAISFAASTNSTSENVNTKLLGSGPTPPDDTPKPLAFAGSGPTPPDDTPKP